MPAASEGRCPLGKRESTETVQQTWRVVECQFHLPKQAEGLGHEAREARGHIPAAGLTGQRQGTGMLMFAPDTDDICACQRCRCCVPADALRDGRILDVSVAVVCLSSSGQLPGRPLQVA